MLTKKQQELLLFIHQRVQEEGIPPSFDEMKDALDLKSKSGIHRLITALEERGFIRRLANRARALEVIRLPEGHESRLRREQEQGFFEPPSSSEMAAKSVRNIDPHTRPATNREVNRNNKDRIENMPALARRGFTPSVIDGGLAAAGGASRGSGSENNVLSGEFGEAQSARYESANGEVPVQIPLVGRIAAGVPIEAIENQSHGISVPPHMVGQGEHFAMQVEGESMIEAGIHDGDTVICHKTDIATAGDIVVAFIDDEEATLKRFRRQGNLIALEAANPAFETRIFDQSRIKVQGRLVGLLRSYQ